MMPAIRAYVEDHRVPGHFLQAVICNDLRGAIDRADEENLANLPAFVGYFYNEAPSGCWGSKEKMKAWEKLGEEKREEDDQD
jgi:hypothetical protein